MDAMFFPLAIVAIVLIALMQRSGMQLDVLSLFAGRARDTTFRSAAAGRYSHIATFAVVVLIVLIALSPESRLFFMVIDAIGFDILVALFALQFRSVATGAWQFLRADFTNLRVRYVWTPGLGPHPNVCRSVSFAGLAFSCAWIAARIVAEL